MRLAAAASSKRHASVLLNKTACVRVTSRDKIILRHVPINSMATMSLFGQSSDGRREPKSLVEFRAGKMKLEGKTVTADTRKGLVYLKMEDTLLHFYWKDRQTGKVEDVSMCSHRQEHISTKYAPTPAPFCSINGTHSDNGFLPFYMYCTV